MMLAIVLIGGLFISNNAEFFNSVEVNKKDGMEWEYVGPQTPSEDDINIPVIDSEGEETIYFKMTK